MKRVKDNAAVSCMGSSRRTVYIQYLEYFALYLHLVSLIGALNFFYKYTNLIMLSAICNMYLNALLTSLGKPTEL